MVGPIVVDVITSWMCSCSGFARLGLRALSGWSVIVVWKIYWLSQPLRVMFPAMLTMRFLRELRHIIASQSHRPGTWRSMTFGWTSSSFIRTFGGFAD